MFSLGCGSLRSICATSAHSLVSSPGRFSTGFQEAGFGQQNSSPLGMKEKSGLFSPCHGWEAGVLSKPTLDTLPCLPGHWNGGSRRRLARVPVRGVRSLSGETCSAGAFSPCGSRLDRLGTRREGLGLTRSTCPQGEPRRERLVSWTKCPGAS